MTAKPKTAPLTSEDLLLIAITADIEAFEKSQYDAALERRRAGIELILSANEELDDSDEDYDLKLNITSVEIGFDLYATPWKRFELLCDSAAKAFPSVCPTNAEILESTATPDLVRYILASFKRYDNNTRNLATAFNLKKQRRGPRDRFGELKSEMIGVAWNRYTEALAQKVNHNEALKCAEEAAYERHREGKNNEQDEREMRRTKRRIGELIKDLPKHYDLINSSSFGDNHYDLLSRFNRMMDGTEKSASMP